jgi:DNA modification methylase
MLNQILVGDNAQLIKTIPDKYVNTIITSPPYYGLRDYGRDGQIGLEETPQMYVDAMVEVFRCVWDVLEDDGTLWLNIGDTYYNYRGRTDAFCKQTVSKTMQDLPSHSPTRNNKLEGLKGKDLIGIPWMLAFALRADGWYLRQDIIWHKPNPMPESVKDRCTKAHEYIFLLSKSDKYHFDSVAIEEPIQDVTALRMLRGVSDTHKNVNGAPGQTKHTMNQPRPNVRKEFDSSMGGGGTSFVGHSGYRKADGTLMIKPTRNKRSVWTVNTKPFKGAHFAVFPEELIEPCILAGAPADSIVLDPFMGSGTTAAMALRLGRQYLGCELNEDYKPLQDSRIAKEHKSTLEEFFT